jgi:malate dehydrogenase (oxaloacetate-decarboxylating)
MLHAEDFGNANAYRLLEKFRPKYSIFNDDIQGTSAAALATLTSALKVTGSSLKDSKIVLVGAGTAGLGITVGIRNAMMKAEGLSKEEANARFWLVDRYGLIHEGQEGIRETQQEFARSKEEVAKLTSTHEKGQFNIYDTVKAVQPTVLIGTSTIARSFTKDIIEEMSKHVDRPIILPISNPTSLCEVDPQDALDWSDGRALLATGSPFPPVTHPKTGEKMKIAEVSGTLKTEWLSNLRAWLTHSLLHSSFCSSTMPSSSLRWASVRSSPSPHV